MAGGEVESTIVTKVVRKLLGKAAKRAGAEAGEEVAKDIAEGAGKQAGKNLGKDLARDSGQAATDAERKTARSLEEGRTGQAPEATTTTKDPINVATGEVSFAQSDVSLPGALPLVLSRVHLSSYRQGGLFGISWASMLDQRLEVAADAIRYAAADGTIRTYPRAFSSGTSLPPTSGPARLLTWLGADGYAIDDPRSGQRFHFRMPRGVHQNTWPITAISDRNGNQIDFDYDSFGVLNAVRHSGGYQVAVDTDGPTARKRIRALRLLTEESSEGVALVRYGYDPDGNLNEVTNSSGLPFRFDYDDPGRMTGWTDRNGHGYHYEYDHRGRAVAGYGTDGYLNASLRYDVGGRWSVLTDSLGQETTYQINERGQVVAETNALGHTTVSEWDERDRLISRTDPLGHTVRHWYDEYGNRAQVQFPDGTYLRSVFDELNMPVQVTGPDGAIWRSTYDQAGNLTAVTDPLGAVTRYTYDGHGGLASVTDPLGNTSRVDANPAGLAVRVTDPLDAITTYQRDEFGRIVAVTDPVGGITRLGWSVEGHRTTHTTPAGGTETWEYDPEGNLVTTVDAVGQATHIAYGPFDVPTSRTGPDGITLTFDHDTELRLIAVTGPQGLTWSYTYDPAGNLVRESDFNGRILRYEHDPTGRLSARVNGAGESITYTRDALGNVVEERAGDRTTHFTYDAAGQLTHAIGPDADVTVQRDPLGRVLAETCNGRSVTFAYDSAGRRIHRRTPSGAETVWTYDPVGRPVGMATGGQTLQFTYDAAGREVRRHIGAGAILDQRYDIGHRLISQALWGAPTPATGSQRRQDRQDGRLSQSESEPRLLQFRTYGRRLDGHITAINDRLSGGRHYDLDRVNRAMTVTAQGWSERYAYDQIGSLTAADLPAGSDDDLLTATTGQYTYTGTLIRRAGRVVCDYDAQGRLIRRRYLALSGQIREWTYSWAPDDLLVAVVTPEGDYWRYRYDPLGRRIGKQRLIANGDGVAEEVDFTWDGPAVIEETRIAEDRPAHTVTWDYQPGTFTPLTQTERLHLAANSQEWVDQQFHAIIADQNGIPAELVDPAGNLSGHNATTLWGNPTVGSGGTNCALRFPGQYYDTETGYHYNYHRYYDPTVGRYITPDPLGLAAGANHYSYVTNPYALIDPLGLKGAEGPHLALGRVSPTADVEIGGTMYRDIPHPDELYNFARRMNAITFKHEMFADLRAQYPGFENRKAFTEHLIDRVVRMNGKISFSLLGVDAKKILAGMEESFTAEEVRYLARNDAARAITTFFHGAPPF
ncbi:RHS repeat-associated core domain-containing protein [Actinoallomurus sp. CA-150999]|uniref:RHS repeat-associated core domain-containing protein n=1 Tax=Actinoallomurus sp. CA-150999 TaxID=3239887 RepID=UPI003D8AB617